MRTRACPGAPSRLISERRSTGTTCFRQQCSRLRYPASPPPGLGRRGPSATPDTSGARGLPFSTL
eukprot:824379-Alexandrium_andersonii.AAC.1